MSGSVAAHADDYAITFDLNPGEYTPVWDQAHSNPISRTPAVSTPIIPEYCYVALREYYTIDSAIHHTTAVLACQKLIALRVNNNEVRNYIATIVPTEEYYMNNQAIDITFNYGDDVDNFSGLVYYHTIDGAFYEVQKYLSGKITNRLNVAETSSIEDFIDKVNSITGVINFGKLPCKGTYTKSWLDADDPEGLMAFYTTTTLQRSKSVAIMRCLANGYGHTCNVRGIHSSAYSAGDRNFSVTNRGYTYRVLDIVVGPSQLTNYNTTIGPSSRRTVVDQSTGLPVEAYVLHWNGPGGNLKSDIQVTIPSSDMDNFYKASGYDHGLYPPE